MKTLVTLMTAAEVNGYAVDLKMCKCTDIRETQLVEQLSGFIQEACQKLALLTGPQRAIRAIMAGGMAGHHRPCHLSGAQPEG